MVKQIYCWSWYILSCLYQITVHDWDGCVFIDVFYVGQSSRVQINGANYWTTDFLQSASSHGASGLIPLVGLVVSVNLSVPPGKGGVSLVCWLIKQIFCAGKTKVLTSIQAWLVMLLNHIFQSLWEVGGRILQASLRSARGSVWRDVSVTYFWF